MSTTEPARRRGWLARRMESRPPTAARRPDSGPTAVARRALVTLELATGAAGLAGGVLLAAAPDGSLLRADPAVLVGSPFGDWRIPGVLLAGLVGGGFLLAGWWQLRGRRGARELSEIAGAGLVCFEAVELAWIGFQPLEAVFAVVGATVVVLAWRTPPAPHGRRAARWAGPRRWYRPWHRPSRRASGDADPAT